MELGVSKTQIGSPRSDRRSPPRLLYSGRLLYWKGVHIAIEALAQLVGRIPDVRLSVVGNGPEESRLKANVVARKLEANVDFVSWMPQQEFLRLYDTHDLLLFPSLHDSTGWVVLEALCHGMPVVCLDLGGPRDIVTPTSGVIVDTSGLNTTQVAARLADKLYEVLSSSTLMTELSAGAITRANDFLLPDRVTTLYEQAGQFIQDGRKAISGQTSLLANFSDTPIRESATRSIFQSLD
jgi:glycosyltransferase involved in cell wall biosynthesis